MHGAEQSKKIKLSTGQKSYANIRHTYKNKMHIVNASEFVFHANATHTHTHTLLAFTFFISPYSIKFQLIHFI